MDYLDIINSKSDSKLANRLIQYIKRNRTKKLNRLLTKKIHPDSILNPKGQAGLHIACKYGNADVLYIFLKQGASIRLQDKKGNLPIHYSLKYCLKSPLSAHVRDLVTNPFLDSSSLDILEIPNRKGTTPKILLEALNNILYNNESDMTDSNSSSNESSQDQEKWEDKISAAFDDDNYDKFGGNHFDDDEQFKNQYNESYDQWADRIFQEYSKRNRNFVNEKKLLNDKADPHSSSKSEPKATKQLKLNLPNSSKNKTTKDEFRYEDVEKLLSKNCTKPILVKSLLPFHEKSTAECVIEAILSGKPDKRIAIREAIRLWHPDKFAQMFRERIPSKENDRVMEIVHVVTRALLNYGK